MGNKITLQTIRRSGAMLGSAPTAAMRLFRQQLGAPGAPELHYVVPEARWAIDWVGHYVTDGVSSQFGWPARVTAVPHLLVGHVVHYGQLGAFLSSLGTFRSRHNTTIATMFHGELTPTNPHMTKQVDKLIANIQSPARIVTACRIMEERLLGWGASSEQVVRIPLGVDLSVFKAPVGSQRQDLRHKLNIADDAICIGSFQKDGEGWNDGLIPKPVKGPDVFLGVIERLRKHHKLFVLLTAPARGFVKRGLDALGVPYRHEILDDYRDIAAFYHCLDLYLVTSREEGGPLAVLEALATGTPLVSTRVGMAPDVIQHDHNGLLADVEDVEALAGHVSRLADDLDLRRRLIDNGLSTIIDYDWRQIVARYYNELYSPLLKNLHPTRS